MCVCVCVCARMLACVCVFVCNGVICFSFLSFVFIDLFSVLHTCIQVHTLTNTKIQPRTPVSQGIGTAKCRPTYHSGLQGIIPHLGPRFRMAQPNSAFSAFEIPHFRAEQERVTEAVCWKTDRAYRQSCHIKSLRCSLGVAFLRSK